MSPEEEPENEVIIVVGGPPMTEYDEGNNHITAERGGADRLPTHFALDQNRPNPFNPVTDIGFSLPEARHVRLEVYNITGQKVASLIDARLDAGNHSVTWDGSEAASGIYLYRLMAGEFTKSRTMILLK